MKTHIKDGLQVFVALLFTGSTAYAMQPTAAETIKTEEVAVVRSIEEPKKAEKPSQEPAKAPETKKAVTWRDNPKNCTDEQFIAAEEPFECIDKPKTTTNHSADAASTRSAPASAISGTKEQWMAAAGIPQGEWSYVDSIVSRESGWNPNAVNASSGACGLGQQLPCGKWAGAWNDPVAALKGQYGYVTARYGGYAQAVAFWNANHWY